MLLSYYQTILLNSREETIEANFIARGSVFSHNKETCLAASKRQIKTKLQFENIIELYRRVIIFFSTLPIIYWLDSNKVESDKHTVYSKWIQLSVKDASSLHSSHLECPQVLTYGLSITLSHFFIRKS